jgi:hypothetical protein
MFPSLPFLHFGIFQFQFILLPPLVHVLSFLFALEQAEVLLVVGLAEIDDFNA